jgi:hypothetical protein
MTIRLLIALAALALSACGGGGGGGGDDGSPTPVTISNLQYSPSAVNASLGTVAVSGRIDFVAGADVVALRIVDSFGTDSSVPISAPGLKNGRVTIPAASIPGNPVGVYSFTVWLRDANGTESNKLTGQIEIKRVVPLAIAGADASTYLNLSAQLDGSKSKNVNGTPTTYAWTIVNPPETGEVTLSTPHAAITSVTCTNVGLFDIQLQISDGMGLSAPDLVALSCIPPGSFALGSTEDDVGRLTGAPTEVSSIASTYYEWRYSDGLTHVRFSTTTKQVVGWRSYDIQLPTYVTFRAISTGANKIAVGITKDDVARIQGTPRSVDDRFSYDEWGYDKIGLTYIRFSKVTGLVTEYRNYDGSLKT